MYMMRGKNFFEKEPSIGDFIFVPSLVIKGDQPKDYMGTVEDYKNGVVYMTTLNGKTFRVDYSIVYLGKESLKKIFAYLESNEISMIEALLIARSPMEAWDKIKTQEELAPPAEQVTTTKSVIEITPISNVKWEFKVNGKTKTVEGVVEKDLKDHFFFEFAGGRLPYKEFSWVRENVLGKIQKLVVVGS